MKPNYIYFYKSDVAVDDILRHPPFHYEQPIKIRKNKDKAIIEYEHFDLRCYRINPKQHNIRGHRTWQILVEDILYDEMDLQFIHEVLMPMTTPYYLCGGQVIKVEKYNSF